MLAMRRSFLRASIGGATFVSSFASAPAFLLNTALAAAAKPVDDTVLVIVQLAGGNDGLNTVVPFDDDYYGRQRNTLRLAGRDVLKISDTLGLHSAMPGCERLFKDGLLSIVQGVGNPNPNQSHEVSMRIWQTAETEPDDCQTGWLGRAADVLADGSRADVSLAFIGDIAEPFTIHAQRTIVPRWRDSRDATLRGGRGSADALQEKLATLPRENSTELLQFVQRSSVAAQAASRRISDIASGSAGDYPSQPLAGALRSVAQLIRAELGIRIFYVELGGEQPGGFDNHANQRDNHAALLRQLSASLAAFVADLRRDGRLDRVLLMTFSEFGRTLAENGRRGTDHGSAAPVFLVGSRLPGGLLGRHPDLSEVENGGVKHHTDFRSLYAAVLQQWLKLDHQRILGDKIRPLDLRLRV